jgi:Domain of unknown function (DUF4440)
MTFRIAILSLVLFAVGVASMSGVASAASVFATDTATISQGDRAADAAAIRAHIESIFQAFIDGDVDKIYATHSEDWRGLLEGSRAPIKGIDEYMRANGIEWPRPANAPKSTPYYPAGTGYKVSDFDVKFYSPELAVASFFGDFERRTENTTITLRRFRIMDVYAKRKGSWIQVASHTVVDPDWRAEQMSKPLTVGPEVRQRILSAREAVWKAYFANDRATLEKLIPEEAIAIDDGAESWSNRGTILAGAQRFAESGAKLVRLEFPKTEMQIYGNTIIIYTSYLYEIEESGKRTIRTGRGTEMFVRRGNDLVNVGWHLDGGQ